MKFVCLDCKKTFIYPATLTEQLPQSTVSQVDSVVPDHSVYPTNIRTVHVCPYCRSLNIDEFVESHPTIVSVKSVELDKVDEWISQGYQVKELYAKMATMVKKEAEKNE